jgi:hypothetical protein
VIYVFYSAGSCDLMEIYIFQVLVVNGGVAAMEVLACCLLDSGDVVLTPSPCYTRIFVNFSERFKVTVVDVLLRDKKEVSSGLQKCFQYVGTWIAQSALVTCRGRRYLLLQSLKFCSGTHPTSCTMVAELQWLYHTFPVSMEDHKIFQRLIEEIKELSQADVYK